MASRLYPEDQKRVEEYLNSPLHQVERKPFRVWWLLLAIVAVITGLGLLARFLAALVIA
ncbi:DUF3094 domain-containing protein [Pseudomonas sp. G11-1]|uniref:DUF3094 domain-containing protein n=1 Tax=Halopseudomonas bauzanensis TaxID=653930 RepID=A0A1I4KBS4_9GAMM|nr:MULTISPECIES: DUF3094 family protein [Halopseudomonas]MCO5785531.1 DUF3094 domain-containing protein [Pseudomonas sp. G11-1]MCO5788365.1 DUF3094 domain-containing protein [Pseudomonas sp. G11-2]TKA93394.1 DUF3094 domain-containing protein [Halopseudomonas bauzanensis]WGK61132.1 DUF3094 family protein [Halopseudomonas sp. SMJS2]SER43024.1 Protein of unknown function [Halopseudomonas bauzanensis]